VISRSILKIGLMMVMAILKNRPDGISHVVSSSCSFDCYRTAAVAAGQHAAAF
jgi:hypothetical protein